MIPSVMATAVWSDGGVVSVLNRAAVSASRLSSGSARVSPRGDEKVLHKLRVQPDFVGRFSPPLRRGWTGLSERERADKSLKS
jgi:hypothetical protein